MPYHVDILSAACMMESNVNNFCFYFLMFRIYPLHDSHRVQLIRLSSYQKHIGAVKEWYVNEHDNWYSLDGERSQWFVWEKAKQIALATSQHIQHYLERIGKGQAHHFCMLVIIN